MTYDAPTSRALWCERGGHVVFHPGTPFMCPIPGCGARSGFALATESQIRLNAVNAKRTIATESAR